MRNEKKRDETGEWNFDLSGGWTSAFEGAGRVHRPGFELQVVLAYDISNEWQGRGNKSTENG